MKWTRWRRIATGLVAVHSIVLGIAMMVAPVWTVGIVGWRVDGLATELFFMAQAGVFLVILGGAYAMGVVYRPFAWLLVASKAAALAFLLVSAALLPVPPAIVLAGVGDGLFGAMVALLLMAETRQTPCAAG
jgi:hypothetical protein